MNQALQNYEADVMDQAMTAFLLQAVSAKSKHTKKPPLLGGFFNFQKDQN